MYTIDHIEMDGTFQASQIDIDPRLVFGTDTMFECILDERN